MNRTVMIVDDNEFVRDSVEIICMSEQIDVVTADSGAACLKRLESGFNGVILMDVMMPEMDGWDTIREIVKRGLYPGNLIVMLTGIGEPDEKMGGVQEYVTGFMKKPFGTDAFVDSMQHYLSLLPPSIN